VTKLADLAPELKEIVDRYRREDHVPGVTVAVAVGDEVIEYAAGVLNLNTGVEATTDSLFEIGSITKTFTATLVMQLVDEGLVDLDEPVRTYVPEFATPDREAAERVTVRQLLCHTSGIDGDVFDDFGCGDDALARYTEALKSRRQLHALGQMFSYCNSGYSVLGRLIERVSGLLSWDVALQAGMSRVGSRARRMTRVSSVSSPRGSQGALRARWAAGSAPPHASWPNGHRSICAAASARTARAC
jgi:CubicO group peptidase (beta-lactamase class C family)